MLKPCCVQKSRLIKLKFWNVPLAHLCSLHDLKGKDKDLEKFISTILSHKYDRRKL
jgi:hypothetical protein